VERSGAQAPAGEVQPPASPALVRGAEREDESRPEIVVAETPGWRQKVLEVYAHLPKYEHFVQRFGNPARARAEYCTYLFALRAQIGLILERGYALFTEYDYVFNEWKLVKVPLDEELRRELQRRKRLIDRRLSRILKARGE